MGREFRASHTDFGWQLNAVNWPLVFLSGLFLGARIFLKTSQRRGLWWDDYILVLSWVTLPSSPKYSIVTRTDRSSSLPWQYSRRSGPSW